MDSPASQFSHLDRILFVADEIDRRIAEMAGEISADMNGEELMVISLMHGSLFFAADLLRRIDLPMKIECLSVASYHGGTKSSGEIEFRQNFIPRVEGANVLIVDDILDTGLTLQAVMAKLKASGAPKSLRVAVLLEKPNDSGISPNYVGFQIGHEFVVGYGLDFDGRYRNLPCIGTLKSDFIQSPA